MKNADNLKELEIEKNDEDENLSWTCSCLHEYPDEITYCEKCGEGK